LTTSTTEEAPQVLDLNLEDLAPMGRQVRIGERLYDVRSPESLGLGEFSSLTHQERRYLKAMQRLQTQPDDGAAAQEANTALNAIVLLILPDLAVEQIDALGYLKKAKVYGFFNGRLPAIQAGLRSLQSQPIMPTSSPASPSGTASPTETS